jgi:hypothetical protein
MALLVTSAGTFDTVRTGMANGTRFFSPMIRKGVMVTANVRNLGTSSEGQKGEAIVATDDCVNMSLSSM